MIVFGWSCWPVAPGSGSRRYTSFNQTRCCAGIATYFATIGDAKNKKREPRIAQETIDLIRKMAQENRLWSAERIRGKLLKLGIRVSKRTIQKYIPKLHRNSSQTWATFLRNHPSTSSEHRANKIWACDFLQTFDVFFRTVFVNVADA